MNWQHLLCQVENMMLDSQITLEEYKEIFSQDNWYEHPALVNEKWWFGRGKKEMVEVTFMQIRSMWAWMGLELPVIMGAVRTQIAAKVDELIRIEAMEAQEDLMVEHDKVIEEEAA